MNTCSTNQAYKTKAFSTVIYRSSKDSCLLCQMQGSLNERKYSINLQEYQRMSLTGELGIRRRTTARKYKAKEITTPAMKLCNKRRLSFVGMNTLLSMLVSSNSRQETCRSEKVKYYKYGFMSITKKRRVLFTKIYIAVVSMKFSIGNSGIRERSHLGCPLGIFDLHIENLCSQEEDIYTPSQCKKVTTGVMRLS